MQTSTSVVRRNEVVESKKKEKRNRFDMAVLRDIWDPGSMAKPAKLATKMASLVMEGIPTSLVSDVTIL